MSEKIEISKDTELYPGDTVELHFEVVGGVDWILLRATQVAIIERLLKSYFPQCEILSIQEQEPGWVIITLQVRPDPATAELPVQQAGIGTAAVIAAIVVGGGVFMYLSLDKVYKITDSPSGQIALVGMGSVGIALLILVALLVIGKVAK